MNGLFVSVSIFYNLVFLKYETWEKLNKHSPKANTQPNPQTKPKHTHAQARTTNETQTKKPTKQTEGRKKMLRHKCAAQKSCGFLRISNFVRKCEKV